MSVRQPGASQDDMVRELVTWSHPPPVVGRSAPDVVDIGPPGTDKGVGVTRALAEVGVAPAHAVVFGDMLNDLPMFALCGYSVAIGNAHPDVIAAAAAVAGCVHDDGFARTLADLGVTRPYRPPDAGTEPACTCRVVAPEPRPEE
jgi:hydroxymethylpyrimidine pyrophosphatase-like HAD family hydrolase